MHNSDPDKANSINDKGSHRRGSGRAHAMSRYPTERWDNLRSAALGEEKSPWNSRPSNIGVAYDPRATISSPMFASAPSSSSWAARATPSVSAAANDPSPVPVGEITDDDVLSGRTSVSHSHRGNNRFRQLVREFRDQYQNAVHRDEKGKAVRHIITCIQEAGGWFLKAPEQGSSQPWSRMTYQQAYEKVGHALRSAKRRKPPPASAKKAPPTQGTHPSEHINHPVVNQTPSRRAVVASTDSYLIRHGEYGSIHGALPPTPLVRGDHRRGRRPDGFPVAGPLRSHGTEASLQPTVLNQPMAQAEGNAGGVEESEPLPLSRQGTQDFDEASLNILKRL